jgi:hypothetical protein
MWFRDRLSATNSAIKKENVVSRIALCDKFSDKKGKGGSENGSLRQIQREKCERWSRESLSATNSSIKMEKVVSRIALCDKFSDKNVICGSENRSLRQIFRLKRKRWFRELLSATNSSIKL